MKLDEDLKEYKERIGKEKYKEEYLYYYCKTKRRMKNNIRFSKRKYENSSERIEEIKNKYKNGVNLEILNELVDKIL